MPIAISLSEANYDYARRIIVRPAAAITVVSALLLFSLVRLSVLQNASAVAQPAIAPHSSATNSPKQSKDQNTSAGIISLLAPKATVNTPSAASTCTPINYSMPTAIDLRNAPAGLTKIIDAPTLYTIFGNQPSDLRSQIQQCALKTDGVPTAQYVSETGSHLSWQYSYVNIGSNKCTIQNVKIGLHINQVMPLWVPTQNAVSGLAGKWQTFMSNLTAHENGHVAIDEQYVTEALNDMQHFPATDCDNIGAAIDYLINADVNTLNEANDNYDATTEHGATQGAILP